MCPSCMVRGKLYKELTPFDWDRFGTSADLDMWLRILEKCPIAIIEEKLMRYRLSTTHGSYQFRFLRTGEADFFKVMDYHLSVKSGVLDIPRSALNKYEFRRSPDKIMRAINYLNKGESQEAKRLLRQSFSTMAFRSAVQSIAQPKLLSFWLCGILLLGSGHLGRYLAKSLRWLLYSRWGRVV